MNKSFFALVALIAMLFSASAATRTQAKPKVKAYAWTSWNQKAESESALKAKFKSWKKHGIVGVCVECGFDYDKTARCAAIAHEVGLEYHAWAPSMLQSDKDSTWYTVNRLGKSAYNKQNRAYVEYYRTLDPHNPDVVKFMVDKYTRLAAVPNVDYVQLDYIRYADVVLSEGLWNKYKHTINHQWRDEQGRVREYPGADYCYCDACVADFKAQSGIDIREQVARGVDPSTIKEWAQFRCDNVTRLVNSICDAVHAKGKKISADVFPGPKSHAQWMVRQEWNKWNIDVFFPMNYNDFYLKPASWVGEVTGEEVKSTSSPVFSGLFICKDWKNKASLVDPENSGLTPSELPVAIRGAVEAGAAGICLFTPASMTDDHWREFEKAIK